MKATTTGDMSHTENERVWITVKHHRADVKRVVEYMIKNWNTERLDPDDEGDVEKIVNAYFEEIDSKKCKCDTCQNLMCEGMYPSLKSVSVDYTVHECSGYEAPKR